MPRRVELSAPFFGQPVSIRPQDALNLLAGPIREGLWLVLIQKGNRLLPESIAQSFAACFHPIVDPLAAEQRWLPEVAEMRHREGCERARHPPLHRRRRAGRGPRHSVRCPPSTPDGPALPHRVFRLEVRIAPGDLVCDVLVHGESSLGDSTIWNCLPHRSVSRLTAGVKELRPTTSPPSTHDADTLPSLARPRRKALRLGSSRSAPEPGPA
jgi:hypothetical protein